MIKLYIYCFMFIYLLSENVLAQTWPLNNRDKLSSAFGPRNKSETAEYPDPGYDYDFHAGIDIGGLNGSNVKAIESGTVVEVGISEGGYPYFVVKSDTYQDWIQYMHVSHSLVKDDPVTGGTVICQVSGNHLDVKWYPYEEHDVGQEPYKNRNKSWHPMYLFLLDGTECDPTNDPDYYVDFTEQGPQTDEKGSYIEIYGRVDDQDLDLTTADIDLAALDESGSPLTTLDLLAGDSEIDDIVDYDLRWNCGDLDYEDSDSGNNNPNILIIPRIFRGGLTGSDSYHTVYFRFYLDPDLSPTSNGQGRAWSLDVEGWCYDEVTEEWYPVWLTTNWVEVDMAICPPCPEDAPPAPTNLTASPNINNNMAVDLAWDPVVGPETGFHVIYRRPYGAPTEAFQSIDITSGETYQDLGCTPGQQYIYAVAGVNYYGEGPNSDDALSTTPTYGTITTRRTWSEDFTITGDVVVNSGAILTVSPGTVARFASGKKLRVYGTLVAEGMSFNPITFTRSNSHDRYWGGIHLYGSNNRLKYCDIEYGENLNLELNGYPTVGTNNRVEYCTITNSYDGSGIDITNNSSPRILHNRDISGNETEGINIYYSDWVELEDTWVMNNNDHGIYSTHSELSIDECLIKNNDGHGVYSYYDDFITFSDDDDHIGGNSIHDNESSGLSAIYYGSYKIDMDDDGPVENSVYNNDSWEVAIVNSGTAYIAAAGVYWGSGPSWYGTVYHSDPLSSDQTGLPKSLNSDFLMQNMNFAGSDSGQSRWREDIPEEELKRIIAENPDNEVGLDALKRWRTQLRLQARKAPDPAIAANMIGYLKALYQNDKKTRVGQKALEFLVREQMRQDRYEDALTMASQELRHLAEDSRQALHGMIAYLQIHTKRHYEARSTLARMKSEYGRDMEIAWYIYGLEKMLFRDTGIGKPEKPDSHLAKAILPSQYLLAQNYPNPFNPITTIPYDLPEPTHVTITIYDILGRQVAAILNAEKPAGYHSVRWDGKNSYGVDMASSVYFYRIETLKFSSSKKLLLLR